MKNPSMPFKTLQPTKILLGLLLFVSFSCKKTETSVASSHPENFKAIGASAKDLLSAATYTSIKLEIQYMPGYAPDAASINNTVTFLNNLVNKPAGITVIQTQIPSSNKTVMTLNDIVEVERTYRTVYTSGNQLGVYFLYTDSKYSEQTALGLAFRNTSMALLGKTVTDNSGGFGQVSRTKLESTVLQHELGHILGLVNLGTPMVTPHQDPNNANHCNNSACLMYYGTNTTSVMGMLGGNVPPLDANCKADLTANGGK
jgi:hypothetical protein